MIQLPNKANLWWLVGILEGEGYFAYGGHSGRTQCVRVKMKDLDVIEKVASLFESIAEKEVQIRRRPAEKDNWNDQYEVYVYGPSARKIMKLVVPHMGYRRRAQIWRALNNHVIAKVKLDTPSILETLLKNREPVE